MKKSQTLSFPLRGDRKSKHSWHMKKRERCVVGKLIGGLERIIPTPGKLDEKSITTFLGINYSLKSNGKY